MGSPNMAIPKAEESAEEEAVSGLRRFANVWTFCILAIVLAGIWAFDHRREMAPDSLTFLDMASEAMKSGPAALINTMWNPLYPGFLALWLTMLRPAPDHLFQSAHLATLLLFCGVAVSFGLLLQSWMRLTKAGETSGASKILVAAFGFSYFFAVFQQMGLTSSLSPDLLVSMCVFLAGWCCIRMAADASWKWPAVLGLVLAASYYAKPVGIPLGVALLAILLIWPPRAGGRVRVLAAVLVFGAISCPLILAISKRAGHPTTSESGSLNYVWHVNRFYIFYGWTGQDAGQFGTPEHAPRVLMENPRVLEFGSPVPGTYPLWYEPSYWYAGVRRQVNVRQQMAAASTNLHNLYETLADFPVLWAGVAALAILSGRKGLRECLRLQMPWVTLWFAAVAAMCVGVHLEGLYVAALLLMLVLGISLALIQSLGRAANPVLLTIALAVALMTATSAVTTLSHIVRERGNPGDDQRIANRLRDLGIHEGDPIATAGLTFDAYWAKLCGIRIVAEAPDGEEFRKIDSGSLAELVGRLRNLGVKALVARGGGPSQDRESWTDLPAKDGEHYSVLLIR